jgi:hypothetical protein
MKRLQPETEFNLFKGIVRGKMPYWQFLLLVLIVTIFWAFAIFHVGILTKVGAGGYAIWKWIAR